jgi:putative hemolysin
VRIGRIGAAAAVTLLLAASGCGGSDDDGPPKPKTVQDAVTLGILAAAKPATVGTSQLASEFCDLAGVTADEVRSRKGGEPPLEFECTLTFTLVNDPTTRYSVDYRTTLDAEGCFNAIEIPGSKQVQGGNNFDATGAPGTLTGCIDLPAE